MKSKLFNVLVFAVGAAVGSAVTWKIVKSKYERIVQEEIESVKDAFANLNNNEPVSSNDAEVEPSQNGATKQINWEELEDLDKSELEEDFTAADRMEYARIANNYTSEKGGASDMATDGARDPYVIAPYDFGELDGYDQIELTYYEGDDTLEDEEYNVITNRNELIGANSLFTFGEYEEDAVFVRNDRLKADFQILKDYRSYEEARGIGPEQVSDE